MKTVNRKGVSSEAAGSPFLNAEMTKADAINLLDEVILKIRKPAPNANGGKWQAGGCYWRLMKVLHEFVLPGMEEEKGHRWELAERFGVPLPFSELPAGWRQLIADGLKKHYAAKK